MAENDWKMRYAHMTAEELEQRLRETFFCPDQIDESVYRELEDILDVLEDKQPLENEPDPEEAWQRFMADRSEEVAEFFGPEVKEQGKARVRTASVKPVPALLRRALIAAVVVVLLAGAALAADSLGLIAWVPKWNAAAGQYEPAAVETDGKPIPAALAELGITEPVYPAKLPKGFVITESHISEDPLILMEQYSRGKERLSITVTPIKGFETVVYQKDGKSAQEYVSGKVVHYAFETENTITVVWYTKHYATTISGNITREEIKGIIDSIHEGAA